MASFFEYLLKINTAIALEVFVWEGVPGNSFPPTSLVFCLWIVSFGVGIGLAHPCPNVPRWHHPPHCTGCCTDFCLWVGVGLHQEQIWLVEILEGLLTEPAMEFFF